MKPAGNKVINALFFQGVWFVTVLGAAYGILWPSLILLVAFCAWQALPSVRVPGDLRLVAVALILGLIFDGSMDRSGLLLYVEPSVSTLLPPLWILQMWVGFALTLNHSLAWLLRNGWVAAIAGAVAGPLAYFSAERLGAVTWSGEAAWVSAVLAVGWGVSTWLLWFLSVKWRDQGLAAVPKQAPAGEFQ